MCLFVIAAQHPRIEVRSKLCAGWNPPRRYVFGFLLSQFHIRMVACPTISLPIYFLPNSSFSLNIVTIIVEESYCYCYRLV